MRSLAVAEKEFRSIFLSPLAWWVATAFSFLMGYFFVLIVGFARTAEMRDVFNNMLVILMFLTPLITMRLVAEERRQNTFELLLTAPVRDFEVILGKFLGALGFMAFLLALTLPYPALLFKYGKPEMGPILSGYLGLLLLGCALISIGLFFSSLTDSQMVAAALSFMAVIVIWLIKWGAQSATGVWSRLLGFLSFYDRFDEFSRGLIESSGVIYLLSFTAFFIYLSIRSLESRSWR
jgi:ABC-2 type transport system permease protein